MVNSAVFCCFSMCLTVYCDEVAISKGTSKGQEHAKTPAASLHRREAPPRRGAPQNSLARRVAPNIEVADS